MKTCILILFAFCLCCKPANAAFIIKQHSTGVQSDKVTQQNVAHYKKIASFFSYRPFGNATHRFAPARYGNDDPTLGVISLAAGLASLACVAVALFASAPVFAVAAGLLAIGAIIIGGIGMKNRPRGPAIAGLCLGVGILLAGLIYLIVIVVVVASFFGGW